MGLIMERDKRKSQNKKTTRESKNSPFIRGTNTRPISSA
jgi:hypothetical protein